MSKIVNVTKGKILNVEVKKAGYKPICTTIYADTNKTVDINLVKADVEEGPYYFGDRILDMATFFCYFKPTNVNYDTMPISTTVISQTAGNAIYNLGVKKNVFELKVNPSLNKDPDQRVQEYEFEYDGSNWKLGSETIILNEYGIFYNTSTSILASGDKIKVVYTVYNKYACFVLDAQYREWKSMRDNIPNISTIPSYSNENVENCGISASYINKEWLYNSGYLWSQLNGFAMCRNLGTFIMPDGIQLNAMVPTIYELKQIYNNRKQIDLLDPSLSADAYYSFNLTDWNTAWACTSDGVYNTHMLELNSNVNNTFSYSVFRINPIFEVPVM